MKQLINYIRNNVLLKIASLNSIAVFVKLITGFLTSKAIAIFVGPEGLALIGNFRNFLTPVQSISTLGLSSGVVKYVSEYKAKVFRLSKTVSSVIFVVFLTTIVVSVLTYFFSEYLCELFFVGDKTYAYVFKILAFSLPFYAAQVLIISVNNGMSQFKSVIAMTIAGQILVTALMLFLLWMYNLKGALIAMAVGEAAIFFVVLFWVFRTKGFLKLIKFKKVDFRSIKNLGAFSIMALFTAVLAPTVTFLIRSEIINVHSIEEAGYWEAMNRISRYYLLFVTSLLSLYILPRYSEITTKREFRKEVVSFYKNILPLFILGLVTIYMLRNFIIQLLFTSEFSSVSDLFSWQQIGDLFKVMSLVIAYQMLAKRMVKTYILTELSSYLILYFGSVSLIHKYGAIGANMAHMITYIFYFVIILLLFRKSLFAIKN